MTAKRLFLYILGLFVLALGVSFSIEAHLGVSPVSLLAYAFTLSTGISIGLMTIAANIIFITIQVILSGRFYLKEAFMQLLITFLFGFFMDFTLFLVQLLPAPESMVMRWVFLIISLFVISLGLLAYFNAKFPLMPYDELTHVISERFNIQFSKAKITSDLLNIIVAGIISLIFVRSLGSIGIGTLAAAYFVGKIVGWLMKHYQEGLLKWVNKGRKDIAKKDLIEQKLFEENDND